MFEQETIEKEVVLRIKNLIPESSGMRKDYDDSILYGDENNFGLSLRE